MTNRYSASIRTLAICFCLVGSLPAAIASPSTFYEADALLRQPRTKFFAVARDTGGTWSTGHGDSYYAGMISNTVPVFVASNGSLEAAIAPNGEIETICTFGSTFARPSQWPGGWVSWPRTTAGPLKFSVLVDGRSEDPSDSWPLRTSFLGNALPLTEYRGEKLDIRSLAFAPVSSSGGDRPRAMIWGIALRNRSPAAVGGELVLSAASGLLVTDAAGRPVGQPLSGGRIAFALKPQEGAWITLAVTPEKNSEGALAQIGKRGATAWLRETCAYWQRITGDFSMPGDPFSAELFTRAAVLSLETAAFDEKGNVAGVLYGTYPFHGADNFRDSYYAILAAPQRDPALLRRVIPWFARYATRPAEPKFAGGVSHSLGNTLNAVMLAGLYYDATADREYFQSNPALVKTLNSILEEVIASRKPNGPWLFPSRFISDGKSIGDYHTGSNVCAWRAFKAWARILDEAVGDHTAAARYRVIAGRIKADLDRHNIVAGPFGRQYIEGTDADGTIPVMIHDGEESDTTLMPFYGYTARDDPAYLNDMRFAASTDNVAFNAATRGIEWETYGASAKLRPVGPLTAHATFPGYLTALAGSATAASLRGSDGYLDEIRRLTDVNGSWWWWPYGKEEPRRGHHLVRGPFECGWAEGEFTALFQANLLGIHYDAPDREFDFAPLPALGDFAWNDFPYGSDRFSVSFKQGIVTFRNTAAHPVKLKVFRLPPVVVPPGQNMRMNVQEKDRG